MSAALSSSSSLALRSYRDQAVVHSHDFPQLVLPLAGRLALDIAGCEGLADSATAAFVAPGARHATSANGPNSALILDVAPAAMNDDIITQLAQQPFLPISPAAGKLVDFMRLMQQQSPQTSWLQHWVPLLLDTLAMAEPGTTSRLHRLMARMEADPGQSWSVADMAASAAISPSRLHEWFQQETGTSPRAWLAQVRMRLACQLLRTSTLPVAEIAQRCGYADQSALTRAMRQLRDTTPASYRKSALPH